MAKTLHQSLESFRKRLRFCVFTMLSLIFIIAPMPSLFFSTNLFVGNERRVSIIEVDNCNGTGSFCRQGLDDLINCPLKL